MKAPGVGPQALDEKRQRTRSGLLLWVLGGLVVVALAVGLLFGASRGPETFRRDSPEAVVQGYIQAVADGRHRQAIGYLSAEAAERCSASALRDAWVPPSLTATLDEVRTDAGGAEVRVHLRSVSGPFPFGDGGLDSVETFTLVREGGGWRIDDDPWPLFCAARSK